MSNIFGNGDDAVQTLSRRGLSPSEDGICDWEFKPLPAAGKVCCALGYGIEGCDYGCVSRRPGALTELARVDPTICCCCKRDIMISLCLIRCMHDMGNVTYVFEHQGGSHCFVGPRKRLGPIGAATLANYPGLHWLVSHGHLGLTYGVYANLRPHETGAGSWLLVRMFISLGVKASGSANGAAEAWEAIMRATGILLRKCMLVGCR